MKRNNLEVYRLFTMFYICAFVGWFYEEIVVLITLHKINSGGLLFIFSSIKDYFPALSNIFIISSIPLILGLPLIEIYGFACIIIDKLFNKTNTKLKLFIYGIVVMTLFELIGSYFCTEVLHQKYWDYSKMFLNFDGRIALVPSIIWGLVTIFVSNYFIPYINNIYLKFQSKKWFKLSITAITIYTFLSMYLKYVLKFI